MIVDLTLGVEEHLIDEYLKGQENKILAQGHIDTHLDTYMKTDIPLEYFKRNGILIDGSKVSDEEEIGMDLISNKDIKKGDFVLIRSGRMEKASYGSKEYFSSHPVLSYDLINYLINKEVSFIGIDFAGIRHNGKEHQEADKLCENNNIYVIENLTNLDKLDFDNFNIYTMWLDDKRATGLRCRVIAESK